MPVSTPPVGGPLGRSRRRLSGSAYSTWQRCTTEWRITREVGLGFPTSASQVLGHVLEEGVVRLIMRHPPAGLDLAQLKAWLDEVVEAEAVRVHRDGEGRWDAEPWRRGSSEEAWPFDEADLQRRLGCASALLLEEVEACLAAEGGPFLGAFRRHEQIFEVPAPCDGAAPVHPLPDRWPPHLAWPTLPAFDGWNEVGALLDASEAWEIIRPWVKDPRVLQPQRLFHPEGWAAGELDLVLRWDGRIRLVDLKSGDGGGPFGPSLDDQLRFYGWMWTACFGSAPDGLEGWYLDGGLRKHVEPFPDFDAATTALRSIATAMSERISEGPVPLPLPLDDGCRLSTCRSCALTTLEGVTSMLQDRLGGETDLPAPVQPFEPLSSIPSRVDVRGRLDGHWGPMPNHFGEPVIGAALTSGRVVVPIEEEEPGLAPCLHDHPGGEVIVRGALPGAWRGGPRLYADGATTIEPDDPSVDTTRLGMLRTRANVRGKVVSIRRSSGTRLDGRPWAMSTFHLWDGAHIIEVAMFGGSLNDRLLSLRPGDSIGLVGAELGWREGLPQLRIDIRSTKVDFAP
jgi:hypothetical protein